MTMANEIRHHAPSLKAELVGELDNDLALFRGIPYATVSKRWSHSFVRDTLPTRFNAKEFGQRCVQREGPVMVTGGHHDATPGDHEFDSLNLNIAVPSHALTGGHREGLPVMVWIHGGGFNFGANSIGRYSPQKLSLLAQQAGTPIILVQISYRLGPLGFAASADLASEVSAESTGPGITNGHTEHYLPGNYGLVDQRNALKWVQTHIADFGGNPADVTAFGISAGSASVHFHILTGDPLFDRGIMMSGSAPTLGPLSPAVHEAAWQQMVQKLGLESLSPSERLAKLRAMSPLDIIDNFSGAALGPVADGKLMPTDWDLFQPQAPTRCKTIVLGDTGVEGIVVDSVSRNVSQESFHALVRSYISDPAGFYASFGFASTPTLSSIEYRDAMRLLFSVVMFQYPNLCIAKSYAGPAYLYHFEEPSPYEGPTLGIPYHGQCAFYMYQNENEVLPASHKKTAVAMGRLWTAFANGRSPWEEYGVAERFMRFGPGGTSQLLDVKSDECRPYGYLEWLGKNWEETKALVQRLLQGDLYVAKKSV